MKPTDLFPAAREQAYQLLFLLYGASLLALRPNLRGAFDLERLLAEDHARRAWLRRLEASGWIRAAEERGGRVLLLTDSGRAAFDGGRDPEAAWNRPWDGNWRMLVFDLPRNAPQARVKFWRWLRTCRFGCLQGSLWITPDPVTDLATAAKDAKIDPDLLLIFTGQVENEGPPGRIVNQAWDFPALDRNYRQYLDFAKGTLGILRDREQPLTPDEITPILREDRRHWWQAVRRDPLLPKPLLPSSYAGIHAWEARCELHAALATALAKEA